MVTLDLSQGSASAPGQRDGWRQARFDAGNALRNGENLLLTLVIPISVLVLVLKTGLGGERTAPQALVARWSAWQCLPPHSPPRPSAPASTGGTAFCACWASHLWERADCLPPGSGEHDDHRGADGDLVVLTGVLSGWWPGDPADRAGRRRHPAGGMGSDRLGVVDRRHPACGGDARPGPLRSSWS